MSKNVTRLALIALSAMAALVMAQPALAYTDLGTTGTTGAHSLTDTSSSPGTGCVYKFSTGMGIWKLKHMYVQPPNVKAAPGHGMEQVAWQFTVQREIVSFGGISPWKDRYTSPKFYATTDSTHNAGFAEESVGVTVPFDFGADASANYRVLVKVFWYDKHSAVIGTDTMRDDWYQAAAPVDMVATRHHFCYDYEDFS